MARKSTMVTSIDEIVGWNKMEESSVMKNLTGKTDTLSICVRKPNLFSVYYLTIAWKKCEQPN